MSVYKVSGDKTPEFYNKINENDIRGKLGYLPVKCVLKDGRYAEIDLMNESEIDKCLVLFNDMLEGGQSWPFDAESFTKNEYVTYYCSYVSIVLRLEDDKSVILGTTYVKPNFPGRCSHICNGGFITNKKYRGLGVATILGRIYLRIAKDLGYRGSLFNLVFANNIPSIRVWEKLGFKRSGVIKNAAKLKGIDGYIDAYQYYYDLTTYNHTKYPLNTIFQYDASKLNTNKDINTKSPVIIVISILVSILIFYIMQYYS